MSSNDYIYAVLALIAHNVRDCALSLSEELTVLRTRAHRAGLDFPTLPDHDQLVSDARAYATKLMLTIPESSFSDDN